MKLFVFLQKELRPDVPKCILLNHKNQQVQKRLEGAKNYVNAFNAFYSFLTKVINKTKPSKFSSTTNYDIRLFQNFKIRLKK